MSTNAEQRGVALLVFLLPLCLGLGVIVLSGGSFSNAAHPLKTRQAELDALKSAKQALIAYAVSYADNYAPTGAGPGHLPCPDLDPQADGILTNDGPNPPCRSGTRYYGRLPRYTFTTDVYKHSPLTTPGHQQKLLEFYTPRSYNDQRLWYAVSPSFVNNPVTEPLNPASRGELVVDGLSVIAVIVAPGPELQQHGQHRPSDSITDYLEGVNNLTDLQFSTRVVDGNDLITAITLDEIMPEVISRVASSIIQWLETYKNRNCGMSGSSCYPAAGDDGHCTVGANVGSLPMFPGNCVHGLVSDDLLDGVSPDRHWFIKQDWLYFFEYRIDPTCVDSPLCTVSWRPSVVEIRQSDTEISIVGVIHVHRPEN